MSWFEFQLCVERAQDDAAIRRETDEAHWDRTRIMWTAFMKANFKKKGGGEFLPQDLIKLSFDKDVPEAEKPNLETFEKLVEKHGKRRKKKKNGKQHTS
jgi:hypothetical protein